MQHRQGQLETRRTLQLRATKAPGSDLIPPEPTGKARGPRVTHASKAFGRR